MEHRCGLRQGDPLSLMLFILIMDVLNALFLMADEEGLLHPLANRDIGHRLSMYADDVVLFIHPTTRDLSMSKAILHSFSKASGLLTNMCNELDHPNPVSGN